MYLMKFPNPHDNYKELEIKFFARDDNHAAKKLHDTLDVFFDSNYEYIKGSITNGNVKLFELREVKITTI